MLSRSILAVLVLPHATYAHRPPQPSLSPPRSSQPTLKAAGTEEATKRTALLAQAEPAAPANRVTDIAAGTYSGLVAGFLNCAAVASIVFAPVGLPLSIAVQHALVGFVVTQLVVTKLTGVGALLAVPSFEALPFMARYAVLVSNALGQDQMPSVLATVLAGSLAMSLLASAMLAAVSASPVDEVEKLLPPALQAGLFAAIGWSLYLLSYDTLGLSFGGGTGRPNLAPTLTLSPPLTLA